MHTFSSEFSSSQPGGRLSIHTKTWTRDSHGLFDYECDKVKYVPISPTSDGVLMRKEAKNEVRYYQGKDYAKHQIKEGDDDKPLANVIISNGSNIILFTSTIAGKLYLSKDVLCGMPVNNDSLTDLQEKIWYVIKPNVPSSNTKPSYISNYQHSLKKNDIIKLGRIKFVVRDLNIFGGHCETAEETFKPYLEHEYVIYFNNHNRNVEIDNNEICRICLYSIHDNANPMISICKCKGTMNLHLNCLKMWLQQKLSVKEFRNKPGISYTIKSFNCEICKEPYPSKIK
jgi:hypothetical protein